MSSPRVLLGRHDLRPRKSLGQNFLVDPTAPDRIADCAGLTADDTVLEVGAGVGTLTTALAARAGRVIAVETDPALADVLSTEMTAWQHVRVVHGDILALDPTSLLSISEGDLGERLWGRRLLRYHVVANLPYYITNAVVRHLLEARVRPFQMVLTVQREVAERMVAQAGEMSLLALSVQFYGKAELCLRLRRGAFYPPPKVESAVVRIVTYEQPPFVIEDVGRFFQVARAGFAQRRKQLRNSLSSALGLDPEAVAAAVRGQDVDPARRAETLSVAEWGRIYVGLSPLLAGTSS